jgi:hypothetical protein
LYACTCEFLLRRESFDVILVNTVISRWGCYNEAFQNLKKLFTTSHVLLSLTSPSRSMSTVMLLALVWEVS